MQNDQKNTLEDLIFDTVRKARAFVAAIRAAAPASTARDEAFVTRCISIFESGRVLDEDAEGAIEAVRSVLRREISTETMGSKRVFDGYHDPEIGDVGRVIEIAVRTVRGDDLAELLVQLDGLSKARNAAVDRLRAEKEVRKRI